MPSNTLIIAEPPNATTKINPVDDANETNKQSNVIKTNAKVTLKYSFFITLPPHLVTGHTLGNNECIVVPHISCLLEAPECKSTNCSQA